MLKSVAWYNTRPYYRQQDLENALAQKGKKFSQQETAYSDWNFFLGRAKCSNCVFYQGNGDCKFTEGQSEGKLPIRSGGLCHAITTNPPSKIEYYYSKIGPNYSTLLYVGIFGSIYYLGYINKKKKY